MILRFRPSLAVRPDALVGVLLLAAVAFTSTGSSQSAVQISQFSRQGPTVTLDWADQGTGVSFVLQSRENLQEGLWLIDRSQSPGPFSLNRWSGPYSPSGSRFFRVLAVPAAQRGKLLSNTLLKEYTLLELFVGLNQLNIPVVPQSGVRVRKVVYETIDPSGARTIASGILALPTTVSKPLPLVSYQHGTLVNRADAPSVSLTGEGQIAVILASTGYAALVSDYLGFGESPLLHPYVHAASEATAAVDMLRAAKTLCADLSVPLANRLFLCGYSQGGHATMALHRELETYHGAEFSVTASAPMAGPYDLSGVTTADFLSGRAMPNPYYFLYLLASYQQVYHLAPSLGDLLRAPYNTTLPPLMDGLHSGSAINAALPADATQVLRADLLEDFKTNAMNPLRVAIRDNDLIHWAPQAPVKMFHCSGDQDVTPLNSLVAQDALLAAGGRDVQRIDPSPGADHGGCSIPSLLAAKAWFDTLK